MRKSEREMEQKAKVKNEKGTNGKGKKGNVKK